MRCATGARFALGAVAAAALAAGCGARVLTPDGGSGSLGNVGGTATGSGGAAGTPFVPTRDVDMLFVIDNSASGFWPQRDLLNNFPALMTALQSAPSGLPNLHVAVITTDMGAGDGSIGGCSANEGDAGLFQYAARGACTATNLEPGATFISNVDGVANYTGNLADVFACIAAVGETGCAFQQPLAAVARALGADGRPMPDESRGFLRPNAFLFIAIVAEDDDCSVPKGSGLFDTKSNTTLDSPLGPVSDFRCNEFGHLCGGVKPPRYAPTGNAGDAVTLVGCTSAESSGMLTPLATLTAQLRSLKPHPDQQIFAGVVTGPSTPYTVQWRAPTTADPAGPWPEISHSCGTTGGSVGDPAVRLNEWASSFGPNGQSLDICSPSYATLLQPLVDHLPQPPPPMSTP